MWATGLCQFPQGHWPKSPGLQSPDAGLPKDSGSPMTGFPDMQSRTGSFRVKKKRKKSVNTHENTERKILQNPVLLLVYTSQGLVFNLWYQTHMWPLSFFALACVLNVRPFLQTKQSWPRHPLGCYF